MTVSVIVPTFNRPRKLALCLASLARRSRLPDEVVVADDGGEEETRLTMKIFFVDNAVLHDRACRP